MKPPKVIIDFYNENVVDNFHHLMPKVPESQRCHMLLPNKTGRCTKRYGHAGPCR